MKEKNKDIKIRMHFLNDPVFVLFLLFEFFVFVYLCVTTNLLKFDNWSVYLLIVFIFSVFLGWLFFRIRVTLDFELGKPRLTAKGLISKTVIIYPFQFCMGKHISRLGHRYTRISDYLMVYTEKKSVMMTVKSFSFEMTDDYYFEKNSTFLDTFTAIGKSKHLVWETFWLLESFEKNPVENLKITKKKIDSSNDLIEKLKQPEKKEFNPFRE